MTYFVVPVLVVEKVGPVEAVKRSVAIMKRTWGEALVGRLGLGLFILLLALPGILLFVVGILLLAAGQQALFAAGIALLVLAVVYFLGLAVVGAALQGIFVSALYQYASDGEVPEGFKASTLRRAFEPR
jgi:cytochrome c biogenesis protein CcdA